MGNVSKSEGSAGDTPPSPTDTVETVWDSIDGPLPRQVTAIVVGCGQRGQNYANFADDFPSRLRIVAAADPMEHRRDRLKKLFRLDSDNVVPDWTLLAARPKMADVVFVCTQDRDHCRPAVEFAKLGYHVLLEKPMAVSEEDCRKITDACQANNVMLAVCHVMRYFPPCTKIKEIIDSGAIGEICTINHVENVGYWHFAHSFVRGNWRREDTSTFSLMAKCCHDIDLISYWMGPKKVTGVQSFGSLNHFKEEKRPEGAADRCLECKVEQSCPYSAVKIYLRNPVKMWPMSAVCDIEDSPAGYSAALREEIKTGPYGRCVYKCDNDVCDSQMVNLQFEDGSVANMTMTAFSRDVCARYTRITGSLGEIKWNGGEKGPIYVYDFKTGRETEVRPELIAPPVKTCGHGGADFFLVNSFLKAVALNKPELIKSGPAESLLSHLMVFSAERSRKSQQVISEL